MEELFMERIMGIYKITNLINNKAYIGQSVDIYSRWKAHQLLGTYQNCQYSNQLYSDIYNLGLDNFSFEIIEKTSFDMLNEREKYWIKYYNTYENGYNLTKGGKGSPKYDYNLIKYLWDQKIPAAIIAEQLGTFSSSINTILKSFGITTEEKYQQSADRIEQSHKPYRKIVYQKDLKTHSIIQTFESVAAAAEYLNINRATFREALQKHNGEYRNYYWEIDNNSAKKQRDFSAKVVAQIDKITNKIINIYPSVSAAARAVGGAVPNITKACKTPNRTVKGYKWKYIENEVIKND